MDWVLALLALWATDRKRWDDETYEEIKRRSPERLGQAATRLVRDLEGKSLRRQELSLGRRISNEQRRSGFRWCAAASEILGD